MGHGKEQIGKVQIHIQIRNISVQVIGIFPRLLASFEV